MTAARVAGTLVFFAALLPGGALADEPESLPACRHAVTEGPRSPFIDVVVSPGSVSIRSSGRTEGQPVDVALRCDERALCSTLHRALQQSRDGHAPRRGIFLRATDAEGQPGWIRVGSRESGDQPGSPLEEIEVRIRWQDRQWRYYVGRMLVDRVEEGGATGIVQLEGLEHALRGLLRALPDHPVVIRADPDVPIAVLAFALDAVRALSDRSVRLEAMPAPGGPDSGLTSEIPDSGTVRIEWGRGGGGGDPLRWLADRQASDGSWSDPSSELSREPATGLATLVFISVGHTHEYGRYRDEAKQALAWIRRQQTASGRFGSDGDQESLLGQILPALALCEIYHKTRSPLFRRFAQRAIEGLEATAVSGGGFPSAYGGRTAALTPTALGALALATARAAELEVEDEIALGAMRFLGAGQDTEAAAALAVAARIAARAVERGGEPLAAAELREGARRLRERPFRAGNPDLVYGYLGMQAARAIGGETFEAWKAASEELEVEPHGTFASSDPRFGVTTSTALFALMRAATYH